MNFTRKIVSLPVKVKLMESLFIPHRSSCWNAHLFEQMSTALVWLTICTGTGTAVVNFLFTVKSRVTHWASTAVSTFWVVCTAPTIEAWTISTSHGTQLTVFTIKARWAGTRKAVFKILLKWKAQHLAIQTTGSRSKWLHCLQVIKMVILTV